MIYTVTFNPAIDYTVFLDSLETGSINRSRRETVLAGGKGVNVSRMLRCLGQESTVLGFVAGFTGAALEQGLERDGIRTDFVHLARGLTRINVKIRSGEETDINARGPEITEADVERLFEKLEILRPGDTLVLAGSIPQSLPPDIYERILARLAGRGVRFVVDATGDLLLLSLRFAPFLIKPNGEELGEIFHAAVETPQEAVPYAQKLRGLGARNVLVSLGGNGALLCDEQGGIHTISAARGRVVNTVGAGDSMVAGFLAGYAASGNFSAALRLGAAAGSATAFSEGLGSRESIEELLQTLQLQSN